MSLIAINGHRLHVETYGDPASPAVVFVHGGPGQGCYHFTHAQAVLLSRGVHLVAVDQRGAMRSDPLVEGTDISTANVVDDLEALRQHLGVEAWCVIGHSAGASIAVDYAVSRPDSVTGLVLDCPALDADLVDRWRLPLAAELLDEMGLGDAARQARQLATQTERLTPATYDVLNQLGERRNELFFSEPAAADEFDRIAEQSGHAEEVWNRGSSHAPLRTDLYRSRLPLLGEIRCPILLVRGVDDPVSPPRVVRAIVEAPTFAGRVEIESARHFPWFERPEVYAAAVVDFVSRLG